MTDHALTIALRRLARDLDCTLEEAAERALRDHLIGLGLLELSEADNDN